MRWLSALACALCVLVPLTALVPQVVWAAPPERSPAPIGVSSAQREPGSSAQPVATATTAQPRVEVSSSRNFASAEQLKVARYGSLSAALKADCKRDGPKHASLSADCRDLCGAKAGVDFCALADEPALLLTAVIAADDALVAIDRRIERDYLAAGEPSDTEEPSGEHEAAGYIALHEHYQQELAADDRNAGGWDALAADVGGLALRAAAALGKLALDRAKQEAVIWLLDELDRRVCSPAGEQAAPLAREFERFWLPRTCSFARKDVLELGYGSGNDMLANLVAALENDLLRLPATASGLLIGAAFWRESTQGKSLDDMLGCDDSPDNLMCGRVVDVRLAAADAVEGVVRGQDPFDELLAFTRRFDEINRKDGAGVADRFHAPVMQVSVCVAAVAAEFGLDDGRTLLASELMVDGVGELELLVAALVSHPACWSLTGLGLANLDAQLAGAGGGGGAIDLQLAVGRRRVGDVERLNSVIRLWRHFDAGRQRHGDLWRTLKSMSARIDRLQAQAGDRFQTLLEQPSDEALRAYLLAQLDVAEQSVQVADAYARMLVDMAREDWQILFPALFEAQPGAGPTGKPGKPETARADDDASQRVVLRKAGDERCTAASSAICDGLPSLATVRDKLDHVEQGLLATRALVERDWASASVQVLLSLRAYEAELRLTATAESEFTRLIQRLSEYVGLFVAIVDAPSSDDLAKVLANTASPPGGWRRKQVPGTFTLALNGFVGFTSAAELRHGQYGATYEHGGLYYQAPTLAIPIGFDLAWGGKRRRVSNGLFVPLIDPVAFLQYDINEGGRLPGPRPLTVLALGALYRFGIPRTPLALLAGYIYRPQLRTWEATVNGPGADAHQFAVMLAVDATLWTIVKRGRKSEQRRSK